MADTAPTSISEWLMDGNHRLISMEISEPIEQLFHLHEFCQGILEKEDKEYDPFWVSSKGKPYFILAVENNEDGTPKSAAYIVGVRAKQ